VAPGPCVGALAPGRPLPGICPVAVSSPIGSGEAKETCPIRVSRLFRFAHRSMSPVRFPIDALASRPSRPLSSVDGFRAAETKCRKDRTKRRRIPQTLCPEASTSNDETPCRARSWRGEPDSCPSRQRSSSGNATATGKGIVGKGETERQRANRPLAASKSQSDSDLWQSRGSLSRREKR